MEAEFLAWLKNELPQGDGAIVPMGDDAAVLDWQMRSNVAVTSDLLADGVHFRTEEHSPEQIGRKLIAVNLSDLAAMAAEPIGVVVSVLLPTDTPLEYSKRLYGGMLAACDEFPEFGIPIVGGDTNTWAGAMALSATAFGHCVTAPLVRSGARPGDALLATGTFGASLFGHHLDFSPRVREAMLLNSHYEIHAAMDVSDGLTLDASRMANASDCGLTIAVGDVPVSVAASKAAVADPNRSALERALSDGEDFELLLAVSGPQAAKILAEQRLEVSVTRIGAFHEERGLWQENGHGIRSPLEPAGHLHGRRR